MTGIKLIYVLWVEKVNLWFLIDIKLLCVLLVVKVALCPFMDIKLPHVPRSSYEGQQVTSFGFLKVSDFMSFDLYTEHPP